MRHLHHLNAPCTSYRIHKISFQMACNVAYNVAVCTLGTLSSQNKAVLEFGSWNTGIHSLGEGGGTLDFEVCDTFHKKVA